MSAAVDRPLGKLRFRPARPGDEVAVQAISAQIWDGRDYVPHVFHDWLADRCGQFTVVCDGPQLVAFGKLSQLRPGEWWLEGLRVDPRYGRRGVGHRLHTYAISLADRIAAGVLRFATSDGNAAVRKMAGASGFRPISRHLIASAQARTSPGPPPPFSPARADDLPAFRNWLGRSHRLAAASGLVEDDWLWLELAPRLEEWQAAGRLYWWRDRRGAAIIRPAEDELLWLNFLDAPATDLPALAADVRSLAARLGATALEGKPVADPETAAALTAAGWQLDQEQMCLYERPLPNRP